MAVDARSTKISAGNGVPTAADILYRNPGAIENRMQLFHLYRLRAQLKLDGPKLEGNMLCKLEFLIFLSDGKALEHR